MINCHMEIELLSLPQGRKHKLWTDLLARAGLKTDYNIEQTVLIWEDGTLIAAGSRQENLLKCIAVDAGRQGEGLTATLLTTLRREAFQKGYDHLFLYTKPANRHLFSSLFFYPVAQTEDVLLMEDRPNGLQSFLAGLPVMPTAKAFTAPPLSEPFTFSPSSESFTAPPPVIGTAVMNCNPFTLGHRYLIESASAECDRLYIFVLSEDKSRFSAADRLEMVRLGTRDLPNVTVYPTGPYLISPATFPTYFLKERDKEVEIHCLLDIEIFVRYYVPRFSITRRYVGAEPLSPMTNRYNQTLQIHLPKNGIALRELPRMEHQGMPISASAVRNLLDSGKPEKAKNLLPQTTIDYLQSRKAW